MKVKEFDDFHKPRRLPWLVGLLILTLLAWGLWRWRRPAVAAGGEGDEPPAAVVGEGGAGTPATNGVAGVGGVPLHADGAGPQAEPAIAGGSDPAALDAQLRRARELTAADALAEARELYLGILATPVAPAITRLVEEELGPISVALATTPRMMPEKITYVVQSGNSVARLAKHFGTTEELIQKSNRISNPNRISVGDQFRILNQARFAIHVSKQANELTLTLNGRFFKRYRVGTGAFGRTPVGTFVVRDRIPEPPWWRPDGREVPFGHPENILGTRWLSIEATGETPAARGYGIHGTWDDSSLGKQSSAGCIRMSNGDVEELFMLVPTGVAVRISE